MELLDEAQIYAVNMHSKTNFEEVRLCSSNSTDRSFSATTRWSSSRKLLCPKAPSASTGPRRQEDRRRLWKARHDAYWAVKTTWAGREVLATDVCVPISRLAECVLETQKDIKESGLVAPIVGHVGDGNFHTSPAFEPADRPRSKPSCSVLLSAPSPWMAPAPASTASARAR